MIEKNLLIIGHPRSGTGYASQLCQAYGLDVGHELMGEYGISSWLFTPLVDSQPPFHVEQGSRNDFKFNKTIAVIRNPVDIIASTAFTENEHSEHWRSTFVYINKTSSDVIRAAQSVVGWYKLITALGVKIYRIEDIEEEIKYISGNEKQFEPDKKYNSRVRKDLSLEDLKNSLPHGLYAEVIKLKEQYEY